jgi:hypothetical protein
LDWILFTTLVVSQPGFDRSRFRYRAIRDPTPLFPDQTFLFGEPCCDRLRFRVPECLGDDNARKTESETAKRFVPSCRSDIAASASTVQPGERFILLLIGHGEWTNSGEFRLLVTTKQDRRGEAWITKDHLEVAVAQCQGEVVVIYNSRRRHSEALESPSWRLVCAAGPNEVAEALTTSASGNVRARIPDNPCTDKQPTAVRLNEIYNYPHSTGCSFASTVTLLPDSLDVARKDLHLLTPAFSIIRMNFRRDTRDADCCKRFLSDSRSLTEGEILDLADTLRNRHTQSVVVQLISTELGWSPNLAVVPFLSIEDTKSGEFITKDMQRAGIPLQHLACRLQASFPGCIHLRCNWLPR